MLRGELFKQLLRVAYPLMLSSASFLIIQFIDRLFLSWHSQEEIAASATAGLTAFFISAFFTGTVSYLETFVAQYYGARQYMKIGKVIWQGFYFALMAATFLIVTIPLTSNIFSVSGHSPLVQLYEKIYFITLISSISIGMMGDAAMTFFIGRGKTKVIFLIIISGALINALFDYLLIFGKFGLPHLGIFGAAIASAIAIFFRASIFLILFWNKKNRDKYHTFNARTFDVNIFKKLVRFGLPAAMQWSIYIGTFAVFLLLIGKIGDLELATTNIVLSFYYIANIPINGLQWAVIILVGQYIGKNKIQNAVKIAKNAIILTTSFAGLTALSFILIPEIYLSFFEYESGQDFSKVIELGKILMLFLAPFVLMDSMFWIFAGVLRGSGDTRFPMIVVVICSWLIFLPLSIIGVYYFDFDVIMCWTIATLYILVVGLIIIIRFLTGKWKKINLINKDEIYSIV